MITIKAGTSPDMIDKILSDEIDQLLKEPGEDKDGQKNEPDPYSLENPLKFNESKFINGIKKLPDASKETKPAYRKSFISEVDVLKLVNEELDLVGIFSTKDNYIKVGLPGMEGNYFIKKETLINWASRYMNNSFFRYYKNGYCFVIMIKVPVDVLLCNCKVIR
jgi:hypothetical protein